MVYWVQVPLCRDQFLLFRSSLNDPEKLCFVVWSEDSSGQFPQELLQNGRDGVDGEAVNVDKPPLLQEMNQLFHVPLVTRSTEHVFLERTLLVQFQQHDLKEKSKADITLGCSEIALLV